MLKTLGIIFVISMAFTIGYGIYIGAELSAIEYNIGRSLAYFTAFAIAWFLGSKLFGHKKPDERVYIPPIVKKD